MSALSDVEGARTLGGGPVQGEALSFEPGTMDWITLFSALAHPGSEFVFSAAVCGEYLKLEARTKSLSESEFAKFERVFNQSELVGLGMDSRLNSTDMGGVIERSIRGTHPDLYSLKISAVNSEDQDCEATKSAKLMAVITEKIVREFVYNLPIDRCIPTEKDKLKRRILELEWEKQEWDAEKETLKTMIKVRDRSIQELTSQIRKLKSVTSSSVDSSEHDSEESDSVPALVPVQRQVVYDDFSKHTFKNVYRSQFFWAGWGGGKTVAVMLKKYEDAEDEELKGLHEKIVQKLDVTGLWRGQSYRIHTRDKRKLELINLKDLKQAIIDASKEDRNLLFDVEVEGVSV